jgi:hypothetical protein
VVVILDEADDAKDTEHEQHHRHPQLQGEANRRRHRDIEDDDGHAHGQHGRAVADAPEGADEGSGVEAARPAHDGCHRDHMVGIGGVLEAEEKAQPQRGQQSGVHRLQAM